MFRVTGSADAQPKPYVLQRWRWLFSACHLDYLLLIAMCLAVLMLLSLFSSPLETHLPEVASRMWQGRLDIMQSTDLDTSTFRGNLYFPGGLTPVILHLPLAWLPLPTAALAGRLILNLLLGCALYALARSNGVKQRIHAVLLALGFMTATAYSTLAWATFSTYTVQIVAVLLVALLLLEFSKARRWWLLGILLAAIFCTRPHVALIGVYIIGTTWATLPDGRSRWSMLLQLGLPLGLGLLAQGAYNFVRFAQLTEFGYTLQNIVPILSPVIAQHGLFSWHYLPANLYALFLQGPLLITDALGVHAAFPWFRADPWGMSIFITSPLLLLGFFGAKLEKPYLLLYLTVALMLCLPLTYYGIGGLQYGYRYVIETYPLLYLLLVQTMGGHLQTKHRLAMLFGLIASLWLGIPLFL